MYQQQGKPNFKGQGRPGIKSPTSGWGKTLDNVASRVCFIITPDFGNCQLSKSYGFKEGKLIVPPRKPPL